MDEYPGPAGSDANMATAVDVAAAGLLAVWEAAREQTTSQLSNSQLRAVLAVEQRPGINLRRLAETLGMLLSSASRLCDRLVAAGVLDREPGRVDRREIALHLTPAGQTLLDELRADRRERLAAVLGRMSSPGRRALFRGLREFDAAHRSLEGRADQGDHAVHETGGGHPRSA